MRREQPDSAQQTTAAENWKLVLSTLLGGADITGLTVTVTDGKIILETENPQHVQALTEIFDSPDAMLARLPYHISERHIDVQPSSSIESQVPPHHTSYPKPLRPQKGELRSYVEKLLGKEVLERVGNLRWSEVDDPDQFILQAECEERYRVLTAAQLDILKSSLSSARYHGLRLAFAAEDSERKPLPEPSDCKGILDRHIDNILFMTTDRVYFDVGRLAEYLTPPDITTVSDEAHSSSKFAISERHMQNYLSLVHEDVVLHLSRNEEDGTLRGKPICLGSGPVVQDQMITLILDRSKSMRGKKKDPSSTTDTSSSTPFDALQRHIKSFLQTLLSTQQLPANTRVRVAFFAEDCLAKEFRLDELQAINAYIDSQKANGKETHLDAALLQELTMIYECRNVIHTVLLLSDGRDNDIDKVNRLQAFATLMKSIKTSSNPPKCWVFGLGEEVDTPKLQAIAESASGRYMALTNMDDFTQIYEDLKQMGRERRIMSFVQTTADAVREIRVQVNEGRIATSAEGLVIPGSFTHNGRQFDVAEGGGSFAARENAWQNILSSDASAAERRLTIAEERTLLRARLAELDNEAATHGSDAVASRPTGPGARYFSSGAWPHLSFLTNIGNRFPTSTSRLGLDLSEIARPKPPGSNRS